MPTPSMTGVVLHDDIEFKLSDNGAFSVRAKVDLRPGKLVLLEHIVYGNMEDMHAALMHDFSLCDTLYPRTATVDNSTKISFNMFSFNGIYVLGDKISKFNHSCNANAFLTVADRVNGDYIYGVWIVANIKAGEEVTLDYTSGGDVELHDNNKEKHNVKCDCTDIDFKRASARMEIKYAHQQVPR